MLAGAVACACLTAACSGSDARDADPTVARDTPTARPARTIEPGVTIEPLRPTVPPATVVRPKVPGLLTGELTNDTPEPGRCPEPVADDATPIPTEAPQRTFIGSDADLRIAYPVEVPAPDPLTRHELVEDEDLRRAVEELLGEDAGRYGVVIKDLSDGSGVAINTDRLFYAASLFKMAVLYEIFHQRAEGLLDIEERYVASDYYAAFGLSAHIIAQCDEPSISDLLYAMMSVSDNVAAVMLQDRAGPRHINNAMDALGLAQTRLLPENALPTTAADMALLVEAIARGEAVDADASTQMADLMATEKIGDRIPAALPEGTLVAHKTANWENATHDVGIVYGERSTYVVVLLSDVGYDGDAAAVQRAIVRLMWQHFEESGG